MLNLFVRKEKVHRPIFVVGCGRAGTTLLFQLLQQHPTLAPTTGYPDGEDHIGWVKYGKALISGLGNMHKEPGVTGHHYCLHMDEADVTEATIREMRDYYWNEVLQRNARKRVINKNPHLSNKLRYVRAIFPDARFIHVVRDCLPTVYSWIKVMREQKELVLHWPDTAYPCFWVMPASEDNRPREETFRNETRMYPGGGEHHLVDYWIETNRNIPRQLEDTPDQLYTLRYEDLVADPLKHLNLVAEFCGLDQGFDNVPETLTCGRITTRRNEEYKNALGPEKMDEWLSRAASVRQMFGYAG